MGHHAAAGRKGPKTLLAHWYSLAVSLSPATDTVYK